MAGVTFGIGAAVAYAQRQDAWYYKCAQLGYDCTTGERNQAALQRYAAKHSFSTRLALFALIGSRAVVGTP